MYKISNEVSSVPLDLIGFCKPELLIREAQTKNTDYLNLLSSIIEHGINHTPVLLRALLESEKSDPRNANKEYAVIDGTQRTSCLKTAGAGFVRAQIAEGTEADFLALSISKNDFVKMTVGQVRRVISKYIGVNPDITVQRLAKDLKLTEVQILKYLRVSTLGQKVTDLLDTGAMTLSNADILAVAKGIPEDRMPEAIDKACNLKSTDFTVYIESFKAKRHGLTNEQKLAELVQSYFEAKPVFDMNRLKTVFDKVETAVDMGEDTPLTQEILYVYSLDPVTVKSKRDIWEKERDSKIADLQAKLSTKK